MRSLLLGKTLIVGFPVALSVGQASAVDPPSYPTKLIRIIASYPPGGGTDTLARFIAQELSASLGQSVIVENRAGGLGLVGLRAAVTVPADGYTLYMGSSDHLVLLPLQYEDLPVTVGSELVPITNVALQHQVLVVHPSLNARTVSELVQLLRAEPQKFSYASQGNGAIGHLSGELFKQTTNTQLLHVPYKGTGPAIVEVLSGQGPSVMFATVAAALPHIAAGKLRPLAVTAGTRLQQLPDVPTLQEAGVPGMNLAVWNGVFAPAKTPQATLTKLNQVLVGILRKPETIRKLSADGLIPAPTSEADFRMRIQSDMQAWGTVVRKAGIEKQRLQ